MPEVLSAETTSTVPSDPPSQRRPAEGGAHVISSAVVTVMPPRLEEVRARLEAMDDIEVTACQGSKIVIVLEAARREAIGGRLAQIALFDAVISANMVFEHADDEEECA